MEDVVGEVGVVVGEGTAHIVAPVAAPFDKVLELRHYHIIAADAVHGLAQAVVYLFSAVEAQHYVVALFVGEVNDLVVEQYAVGRKGKAKVLALLLFDAPAVGGYLFDHLKVHQRLSAEEVDLEVPSRARVLYQKVDSLFSYLKAHQRPVAVILALTREAVFAVEVAGVRDVQAQRLDHGVASLEVKGEVGVIVRGKELTLVFQLFDIRDAVAYLSFVDLAVAAVFFEHQRDHLVSAFILV